MRPHLAVAAEKSKHLYASPTEGCLKILFSTYFFIVGDKNDLSSLIDSTEFK